MGKIDHNVWIEALNNIAKASGFNSQAMLQVGKLLEADEEIDVHDIIEKIEEVGDILNYLIDETMKLKKTETTPFDRLYFEADMKRMKESDN